MDVRPLDLSGILGRAIALYAGHFRTFAGIALVAVLPLALMQYVTMRLEGPQLDAMLAVWQNPESTARLPALFDSPATIAAATVSALVGYVLTALAVCAVGVATADVYRDEPVTVGAAYGKVLARWPAILGVLGIALGVLIVCYVVLILIVSIPLVIAMMSPALALVVPVAALLAVLAVLFALALLLVSGAFACFGIVVEGRSVPASIELAASRIFTRPQFARALLYAIVAGAVSTVPVGLVDTAALLGLQHWPAAYIAFDSIVRWAMLPLSALILAVYYFDVRMRHEGVDLEDETFGDVDDAGYAPTAYLSGHERALIKRFLERRDTLTPQRRAAIAAQLAQPVRERVPAELRGLDDESLLERL